MIFFGIGIKTQGVDIDVFVVFGGEDLSRLRSGGTAIPAIPVAVSSIVDTLTYAVGNVRLNASFYTSDPSWIREPLTLSGAYDHMISLPITISGIHG